MGPFIKDVINQGEGVCQKMILITDIAYLVKMITKRDEGGQKYQKSDDVFYEQIPKLILHIPQ